jgi:protein TonB
MRSLREPLPAERIRRCLARVVSPRAMESVFDPFIADLQADWLHAKSTRSASYTRWSLLSAYGSLVAQLATFALGSLFGPRYELAPAASAGAPSVDGGIPATRASRYAAPLVIAALITFGLFAVMSALIAGQPGGESADASTTVILTSLPNEPDPVPEPDPVLPPIPPSPPLVPRAGIQITASTHPSPTLPGNPGEVWGGEIQPRFERPDLRGPGADQSEIPIVRVEPVYPQRALDRGIEGWVEVEFTVTEVGSFSEPTILRSHPSAIFDRAALRAIERWKYEPKVVDGQPVARPGMRNRFRFELRKSGP